MPGEIYVKLYKYHSEYYVSGMKLLTTCLLVCLFFAASGQRLFTSRVEVTDSEIIIQYNLESDADDRFVVQVYHSLDSFSAPMMNVSGDVGNNVIAGPNKTVRIPKNLFSNSSEVQFEILAERRESFISIDSVGFKKKVRRGRPVDLVWKGGDPKDIYTVLLSDGSDSLHYIDNTLNNGSYTWIPSMELELKQDYSIQIININNPAQFSNTNNFKVYRKIPLALWGLAGGIPLLTSSMIEAAKLRRQIGDPPGPPDLN